MTLNNGFPVNIENGGHHFQDLVSMPEGFEDEINEDLLCEQCFEELTCSLPVNNLQPFFGSPRGSSRCFTCDASFLERSHVTLREGPEHDEIARTSQKPIPLNVKVCQGCWFEAYRSVRRQRRQNQWDTIRNIDRGVDDVASFNLPIIIAESCVLCDKSLQGRTYIVPEDPDQNKNIQYIIFLKD